MEDRKRWGEAGYIISLKEMNVLCIGVRIKAAGIQIAENKIILAGGLEYAVTVNEERGKAC